MNQNSSGLANHILPTAANLLGICFLIFSITHLQNNTENTVLDDFSAFAILIFLISCLLSYISLRTPKYRRLEKLADISFLIGLITMVIPASLIAIHYIR